MQAGSGNATRVAFLRYALAGAAGTVAHYALLLALVSLGLMAPAPASVLGALFGAVINFMLNAAWTFSDRARSHFTWRTAARFFATAVLAAALNGIAMTLLVDGLGLDYRLAQLLVTAMLLGATFLVNASWTFQARPLQTSPETQGGARLLPLRGFWPLCALVTVLALLLRLPTLESRSLWLDETYSAWFAAVPLRELWTSVPLYETHPPFYYTLLKGWTALFGNGEAAMRTLSVLASTLTVFALPAGARLARLGATAERVALLAALFLAVNANSILFAQQARPYALQALSGTLAVFFSCMLVLELARGSATATTAASMVPMPALGRSRRLWAWSAGLALSAGVTLWLHNTGVFAAFGIWTGMTTALLLAVPGPRRPQVLAVGLAGLGALLVWSPFLPMLVKQGEAMAKLAYWIGFKPRDTIAAWSVISGSPIMHYPVAALVALAYAWLWRRARAHFWLLGCVMSLPILALAGYSYVVKPLFLSRLFAWLAPLGMVLLALGIHTLRPRWRPPAIAVILLLSAWSVNAFYRSDTENWREMLAQLTHESRPGDLVLAFPNEVQMPVTYYATPGRTPGFVYLPGPFPALGLARRYVGNAGAPGIAAPDIAQLRTLVQGRRRVWLVERLAKRYDPDNLVLEELGRRYRLVKQIDGNGAVIRLYEAPLP
ncbi:GtrA family protein [Massilia consociata]|uniref:GtrA family protein n=1 Tax=Massilia consociata TaxID=760117 RepID=A0ABV6FAK2_9BURK